MISNRPESFENGDARTGLRPILSPRGRADPENDHGTSIMINYSMINN